jgi:diguanylate cyclase (GGDEF)-like protein
LLGVRRRSLLVFFCALVPTLVQGARPAVRHYDLRDGLPQSQVTAILQDPAGYLWVGTLTGGVGRYDGRRWRVYDSSSGLPGAAAWSLALDRNGTLFAGTGGGPARLSPDGFLPLRSKGEAIRRPVVALLPLPDGTVLLGAGAVLGVWVDDERPLREVRPEGSLLGGDITTLARDDAGTVFVGTTRGLARLRLGDAPALEPVPGLPAGRVRALLARAGRPLLVSVEDEGLFEGASGSFRRLGDATTPGGRVLVIAAEHDDPDVLWLGTEGRGAFCRRGGRFEAFSTAEGLSDNRVSAIFEDREGVLWFGTDSALTKRGPSSFLRLDQADGFPPDAPVFGMTESRDGALWFSASQAGLIRVSRDGTHRRFTAADGLPDPRVVDVAAHPGGGVVVATRGGLARIEGDRVRTVDLPPGVSGDVRTLLVEPDGRLLLGTRSDGLVILHPDGRGERVDTPVGAAIIALYRAADGTLWVGGEGGGAWGWKPGQPGGERLTHETGLPSNDVTAIFVDSRGTLWVGTDAGAWRRDPDGRVRIVDRRSGLPDSFVYWVGEDRQGELWFGTNRGAALMSPAGGVKVFTSRDGLGTEECNEDGFFVDSRGDTYIGTLSVSRYVGPPRPRRDVPPPIWIEDVVVDGRPLREEAPLALPPATGSLTFRFVAPSFTDESGLRYRYRLRGLGDAWTQSEAGQGETTYGGLPPGSYHFEVLAETSDGRVSTRPATLPFTVSPSWWQTRLFMALLGMALCVGLFLVVRAREAVLVAARQKLEREVRERTDELRRANERLAGLAVTDDLTGVANRRRILEGIQEAMAFARRRSACLSVLLADLDGFKEVNDRLGHAVGDEVLRRVARAMEAALRTEDLLGRYGGDEFVAVLPGTNGEGAREAAERLRQAVLALDLGIAPLGFPDPLALSVGVATFERKQSDPSDLVRRADEALYRAKAAGKNRVSD